MTALELVAIRSSITARSCIDVLWESSSEISRCRLRPGRPKNWNAHEYVRPRPPDGTPLASLAGLRAGRVAGPTQPAAAQQHSPALAEMRGGFEISDNE